MTDSRPISIYYRTKKFVLRAKEMEGAETEGDGEETARRQRIQINATRTTGETEGQKQKQKAAEGTTVERCN
jgi:hypothetical protein